MMGLEGAIERLRPLVDSKEWDYCVVWKLGHDPSRFIQWLGCCCGGAAANYRRDKVNEEAREPSGQKFCKDVMLKHPLSTKACQALARLPPFFPLYSGVHDEVVVAQKPRWTNHANAFETDHPSPSTESAVTRVFIPVMGGLVELFAAKHIAEERSIVDYITSLCNVHVKQETLVPNYNGDFNFKRDTVDLLLEERLRNLPSLCRLFGSSLSLPLLPHVTKPNTLLPLLEGSSSGSNPSTEHPSFDSCSGQKLENKQSKLSIANPSGSGKSKRSDRSLKKQALLLQNVDDKVAKFMDKAGREGYKSRNLETERNRRKKINSLLLELRALVPNISKMDKAAILGDASDYILQLREEVKSLQDELRELEEEEESNKRNSIVQAVKMEALSEGSRHPHPTQDQAVSSSFGEKSHIEFYKNDQKLFPQDEPQVKQIDRKEFLMKFLCEQSRGGVARLLDNIYSLEVQVMDANVTTINGKVLYILKVQANKDIEPEKLRRSLVKVARSAAK
ncbi:hypothetical protein Tsubulata_026107 [Turnera subulata]|uniref:BHLH domain-containing protein n=1 Tax=Turnera subulata TaxID=218843 RepID=A0A9Q0G4A0_9ROSI|nr:hypothetical protein Tsubulata_026107 [Turnera subulata]